MISGTALAALRRFAAASVLLVAAPLAALAGEIVNTNAGNVAIDGYDPVAYHTIGAPTPGDPAIRHEWHDAIWQFSTPEHRALFVADPDRYAPHFGGFCAGGMSLGQVVVADPEAWTIVDGQLFLNANQRANAYLLDKPDERIAQANENWKTLGQTD